MNGMPVTCWDACRVVFLFSVTCVCVGLLLVGSAAGQSVFVNDVELSGEEGELQSILEKARKVRVVHLRGDLPDQEELLHEARARLCSLLYNEAGYSVLILPVGIYEGAWVSEKLNDDASASEAALPLYRVWRESEAFLALLETIRGTRSPGPGIEIIGGLCRYHATGKSLYTPHLLEFFQFEGEPLLAEDLAASVTRLWGGRDRLASAARSKREEAAELADLLLEEFDVLEEELEEIHGASRVALERQFLLNMQTFLELEQARAGDHEGDGALSSREKSQNLAWFLNSRYPDARLIYWEGRGSGRELLLTEEEVFPVELTVK